MIDLNIYIIHSDIVKIRKDMCMKLLNKLKESNSFNITTHFITEHEADQIPAQAVKQITDFAKTNNKMFDGLLQSLHIRNVSNSMKHYKAIQMIASSTADGMHLVIEDDVIYGENVSPFLHEICTQFQSSGAHMCFLGLPSSQSQTSTLIDFKTLYNVAPACESFLLSTAGAKMLLKPFLPIKYKTNIHLSYLISTLPEFKCCLSKVAVFIDGSKLGVYLSSIEVNNQLFMNPDYFKLKQLVDKNEYTEDDKSMIRKLLTEIKFRNHPDIVLCAVIFEEKIGNYSNAMKLCNDLYTVYKHNNCIVNNESNFLKTYISLFRHCQA